MCRDADYSFSAWHTQRPSFERLAERMNAYFCRNQHQKYTEMNVWKEVDDNWQLYGRRGRQDYPRLSG